MARKPQTADFLTRAMALGKARSIPDIPDLDMKVYVRALSRADVNAISSACLKPGKAAADDDAFDEDAITLHITAASIIDAKGNRLVPAGSEDRLNDLPNHVYMPLQTAALRANGMGVPEGN